MGGNAFKNLNLNRINRNDVAATVKYIVNFLDIDEFTNEYAMASLMGSVGKKNDSGDIDFCMNTQIPRFVGEPDRPVFDKHELLMRVREVLPLDRVNSSTVKMGNLMTAFPIAGDESNGLIQVDFVFGPYDLLQFTHYSPGDDSEFKGVFLSQAFGILTKMLHKYYDKADPETGERIGRVGLHLSLENGLYCRWESRKRPGMGCSVTTADEFETRFGDCPRYPRIGYITNPDTIIDIIFGGGATYEQVNTFEKVVDYVRVNLSDRYVEFWERFMQSAGGSGIAKQNGYDPAELACHPVWKMTEEQRVKGDK